MKAADVAALESEFMNGGIPFHKIGEVTARTDLTSKTGSNSCNRNVAALNETFEGAIPKLMES